jgi:hypothetical protein
MYLDPALAADIAGRREHLEPGQDIAVALDSGGDPIGVVVADGDPESASQPSIVVTDADENALDFAALAGQLREGADTINIDGVQYCVPAAIGYELSTAAR